MQRARVVAAVAFLACACASGKEIWVVDRFEGTVAVLVDERGEQRSIPLGDLPGGIAEGEALVDNRLDDEEAQWLRRECAERRARMSCGDDGADFSLEEAP